MNILKQLLLTIALVVGISITASAQSSDKKPPPKQNPPSVPVEPKKPKEDKPKDNDKGKKPGIVLYLSENRIEIDLV